MKQREGGEEGEVQLQEGGGRKKKVSHTPVCTCQTMQNSIPKLTPETVHEAAASSLTIKIFKDNLQISMFSRRG